MGVNYFTGIIQSPVVMVLGIWHTGRSLTKATNFPLYSAKAAKFPSICSLRALFKGHILNYK